MDGQKMNPEVKAKWVAALRSGKYEQGKDRLRTADDKFCCFGVLCDLSDPKAWSRSGAGNWTFHDINGMPSERVREWAGLKPVAGRFQFMPSFPPITIGGVKRSLDGHNDDGATFAQIADAIEAQL